LNLVTGASGHIGNVLIRHLLEQNQSIRALVLPNEDRLSLQGLPIDIRVGDVLDAESLILAMEDVEVVYHLAGIISILPGRNDHLRSVNIIGTRNMVWACQQARVRRFIYTSSIHALQRIPKGTIIDESIPFDIHQAISEYDQSKAQASLDVIEKIKDGLDAVIVCPTGVIGPYDYGCSEMGRLILDFIQKRPQFYIDGAYDFVDVRDVARGLFQAAEQGKKGETYILSGEKITVANLLGILREFSGYRPPILKIPFRLAKLVSKISPFFSQFFTLKPRLTPYSLETLLSNSDISHAKATIELEYHPRPLTDTIHDTITWFTENQRLFTLSHNPLLS